MDYASPKLKSPAEIEHSARNPIFASARHSNGQRSVQSEYPLVQNFGNTVFMQDAVARSDFAPAPAIAQSMIDLIVKRALRAKREGKGNGVSVLQEVAPNYTHRSFFQSAFEAYLTCGNVLLFRDLGNTGSLRFAINPTIQDSTTWSAHEYVIAEQSTMERQVAMENAILVRWEQSQGQRTLGRSPIKMAEPYIVAYNNAIRLLNDYAAGAHKIGQMLEVKPERSVDPDVLGRYAASTTQNIVQPGCFIPVVPESEYVIKTGGTFTVPILREAIVEAVSAIARVWHVPLGLMGIHPSGVRQLEHELEMHILEDAVRPMLDDFSAALSAIAGVQEGDAVVFDSSHLGLPSITERAEAILKLSQSGAYKINEIRAITEDGPLQEGTSTGEKLPVTAGAGERDSGEKKKSGSNAAGAV